MISPYWKNLRSVWGEAVNAFAEWADSIGRNIVDPLHDEQAKAKARIGQYTNDKDGVDRAIAYIRKLPGGEETQRFITYTSALQQFVICGVDVYPARGFVKACVNAEMHSPHDDWEHRVRILMRIVATGRVTRKDHRFLAQTGIVLPWRLVGKAIAWNNLLPIIHESLPYMQVED